MPNKSKETGNKNVPSGKTPIRQNPVKAPANGGPKVVRKPPKGKRTHPLNGKKLVIDGGRSSSDSLFGKVDAKASREAQAKKRKYGAHRAFHLRVNCYVIYMVINALIVYYTFLSNSSEWATIDKYSLQWLYLCMYSIHGMDIVGSFFGILSLFPTYTIGGWKICRYFSKVWNDRHPLGMRIMKAARKREEREVRVIEVHQRREARIAAVMKAAEDKKADKSIITLLNKGTKKTAVPKKPTATTGISSSNLKRASQAEIYWDVINEKKPETGEKRVRSAEDSAGSDGSVPDFTLTKRWNLAWGAGGKLKPHKLMDSNDAKAVEGEREVHEQHQAPTHAKDPFAGIPIPQKLKLTTTLFDQLAAAAKKKGIFDIKKDGYSGTKISKRRKQASESDEVSSEDEDDGCICKGRFVKCTCFTWGYTIDASTFKGWVGFWNFLLLRLAGLAALVCTSFRKLLLKYNPKFQNEMKMCKESCPMFDEILGPLLSIVWGGIVLRTMVLVLTGWYTDLEPLEAKLVLKAIPQRQPTVEKPKKFKAKRPRKSIKKKGGISGWDSNS